MMGLRLAEGIPLARFEAETGRPSPSASTRRGYDAWSKGWLPGYPRCPALRDEIAGRQRLDAVLGELLSAKVS